MALEEVVPLIAVLVVVLVLVVVVVVFAVVVVVLKMIGFGCVTGAAEDTIVDVVMHCLPEEITTAISDK